MTYLIYYQGDSFYTNWFSIDNNYMAGMIVWNLIDHIVTYNGVDWVDIKQDHL
jgi:hypothetical protein